MRDRVVALAMALGVVAGAVTVGVLAVGSGDDEPAPLPVLGAAPTASGGGTAEADHADAAMVAPGSVHIEVAGDLPALDGEAAAWRVDREVDLGRIEALAAALGVDGGVEGTDLGWAVDDGAHRLEVQRQPGLPWWYGPSPDTAVASDSGGGSSGSSGSAGSATAVATPAPGCTPEQCVDPATEECLADGTCIAEPPADPDTAVTCDKPECPPDVSCTEPCGTPEPPADKPSQDQAREQAAPILEATGVDLGTAAVRLDDTFTGWAVTADPVVGGLPTVGMSSSVTVGPDGVEYAGGWLSTPSEGDTYPLIGTAAALARYEEQGAGGPIPLTAGAAEPMICEDDGSGGCLPPEPITLRITGARLALQLMPVYDADDGWLVPAYLFEVDGGGPMSEIPVLAVPDEYLIEPPAPEDPAVPPGCEVVGGDAVACPEPGQTEPGQTEPGQTEPGEPGEPDVTEPAPPVTEDPTTIPPESTSTTATDQGEVPTTSTPPEAEVE